MISSQDRNVPLKSKVFTEAGTTLDVINEVEIGATIVVRSAFAC